MGMFDTLRYAGAGVDDDAKKKTMIYAAIAVSAAVVLIGGGYIGYKIYRKIHDVDDDKSRRSK